MTIESDAQNIANKPTTHTQQHFDVLIVGAGPAGMAAACCAADSGCQVGVIDDNPDTGGQIWRRERNQPSTREARRWFERVRNAKFTLLTGSHVVGASEQGVLVEQANVSSNISYEKLIIATGARERFLPFPGWTRPGVMGAGGLQAMVKSGLPIEGKRVIVAGSGPLLLAVSATLRKRGAKVLAVLEQAPSSRLFRFGLSLWRSPGKLWQAFMLRRGLSYRPGCWVTRVDGHEKVESVTFTDGQRSWTESCDYLACGYGLVPNIELPALLGCMTKNGAVQVDAMQCGLLPTVYCVGELTGIGGLELSLLEGQIAGYAVANRPEDARRLFKARDRARRFAQSLESTFALRDELRHLCEPDTIVCRCEDVTFDRLKGYTEGREAKLQTRCGMGPCQGRVCGSATRFLFGWAAESTRPPILPTPIGILQQSTTSVDH